MVTSTFGAIDWKAQQSEGKTSTARESVGQAGLRLLGEVPAYQILPVSLIQTMTFNGTLNVAVRHIGLEDQQIAVAMHISGGYMSKFMRGVAQVWARRMVLFMRTTRSLAPLQKMA